MMENIGGFLIGIYFAAVNFAGFISMGVDKSRARRKAWRISERTLFLLAAAGGSIGSIIGMRFFHHKTKHWYFVYGLPAILAVQLVLAGVLAAYAMTPEERETMIDNVLEDKNEEKAQYMSELERVLSNVVSAQSNQTEQNAASLQKTADTLLNYDTEGAYRVYILDTLLITALKDTGSFASAISDTVQWKVPVTTADGASGLVVLLEKDGVLEYVGTSVGEAVETWFVTDEQIRNAVISADEVTGGINSMQIAHSYLYNTTFVYLTAEDGEYLIPFSYYAERIELENGKLYTVSEITDIFDMYFDEQQLIDSPNNNGGVPFRTRILISTGQDESRRAVLSVKTAAAVIAASLAGIFVLTYYIKKSGGKRKGS